MSTKPNAEQEQQRLRNIALEWILKANRTDSDARAFLREGTPLIDVMNELSGGSGGTAAAGLALEICKRANETAALAEDEEDEGRQKAPADEDSDKEEEEEEVEEGEESEEEDVRRRKSTRSRKQVPLGKPKPVTSSAGERKAASPQKRKQPAKAAQASARAVGKKARERKEEDVPNEDVGDTPMDIASDGEGPSKSTKVGGKGKARQATTAPEPRTSASTEPSTTEELAMLRDVIIEYAVPLVAKMDKVVGTMEKLALVGEMLRENPEGWDKSKSARKSLARGAEYMNIDEAD
ncbi:hypothetical protein BD626DRAFT_542387 [Schizophyllum amplum]|uniref:Uncharacterized protein n=1 Tax=Schizophyllum amplum TaxID=97359 RepID=A0A550BSL0_9AGAR|nr:hypothetical protein BD626DRAFT_542387 [Auriculariopsis ampla]